MGRKTTPVTSNKLLLRGKTENLKMGRKTMPNKLPGIT